MAKVKDPIQEIRDRDMRIKQGQIAQDSAISRGLASVLAFVKKKKGNK
jgi:hypothetical protein